MRPWRNAEPKQSTRGARQTMRLRAVSESLIRPQSGGCARRHGRRATNRGRTARGDASSGGLDRRRSKKADRQLIWVARKSEPLERRVGRLRSVRHFWVAAERLPMVQAVYPGTAIEPAIVAPAPEAARSWDRADAIRELVRGRVEAVGPVTAHGLSELFLLPLSEIQNALMALEGEGSFCAGNLTPAPPKRSGATDGCWLGFIA